MNQYNIVLADDHAMFRHGIRKLIEEESDLYIVGEVNDGLELLELLKTVTPDLIILDIAMPNLRGLDALRELTKYYPQVKVLILSMHGNREFVRQAVSGGAEGFILKEQPSSELMHAIKVIKGGHKYFSPVLSTALLGLVRGEAEDDCLTKREKEILHCLARGLSAQKISDDLYISIHTVRRHRSNIMQKLKITSYTDLLKFAISQGYAD